MLLARPRPVALDEALSLLDVPLQISILRVLARLKGYILLFHRARTSGLRGFLPPSDRGAGASPRS